MSMSYHVMLGDDWVDGEVAQLYRGLTGPALCHQVSPGAGSAVVQVCTCAVLVLLSCIL